MPSAGGDGPGSLRCPSCSLKIGQVAWIDLECSWIRGKRGKRHGLHRRTHHESCHLGEPQFSLPRDDSTHVDLAHSALTKTHAHACQQLRGTRAPDTGIGTHGILYLSDGHILTAAQKRRSIARSGDEFGRRRGELCKRRRKATQAPSTLLQTQATPPGSLGG